MHMCPGRPSVSLCSAASQSALRDPRAQILKQWADNKTFAIDKEISRDGRAPFSILMPPPNVTGNLHAGHALTFTVQASEPHACCSGVLAA